METIKVAAISTQNWIGEANTAIQNMNKWLRRAAEQGVELALFPELNVNGYFPSPGAAQIAETVPGPSTEKIMKLAQGYGMVIAFGLVERVDDFLRCTHVLVSGEGVIGKQSKIHVPAHERAAWQAGESIQVFDIGKARVGITVCRDAFFDEMTRSLYFKGAEIVLMPFTYYNVPRSQYLKETIHGMSLVKSAWSNGYFEVVCNSAGERLAGRYDPRDRKFPGWAGVIDPWGTVLEFVEEEGNGESIVMRQLDPEVLRDRREHPNFLAKELQSDLYQFKE